MCVTREIDRTSGRYWRREREEMVVVVSRLLVELSNACVHNYAYSHGMARWREVERGRDRSIER